MTEPEKQHLSNHVKFGLVILINLLIPGLGNLIFVGRSIGNIIFLILCFWAWTGHDFRITGAWYIFMAVKAIADLYIIPAQVAKRHAEDLKKILHKPDDKSGQPALHAVTFNNELPSSHPIHSSEDPGDAEHYFDGSKPVAHVPHPKPHMSDHPTFQGAVSHLPSDHDEHPSMSEISHSAPQPLTNISSAHPAPQSLNQLHSEHPHSAPQPLNQLHSEHPHSAPQPLNQLHSEHPHSAPQPLNQLHSEHPHSAPQPLGQAPHAAPQPLNQQANQNPAPPASHSFKAWSPTDHAGSAHGSVSNPDQATNAFLQAQAENSATEEHPAHGQIINQHKVIDSLLHAPEVQHANTDSQLQNPHDAVDSLLHSHSADEAPANSSGQLLHQANPLEHPSEQSTAHEHASKLAHPSAPLSEAEQKQLEHQVSHDHASDEGEFGMIVDIYGDEEDDDADQLSPLEYGLFHKISDPTSTSSSEDSHESQVQVNPSQHLKPMGYGSDEMVTEQQIHHKKRVQLCLTCQRPRDHNRPTCPACGTSFEDGAI